MLMSESRGQLLTGGDDFAVDRHGDVVDLREVTVDFVQELATRWHQEAGVRDEHADA